MYDIILCVGCGTEIYDFEERISNSAGEWHFECYLDKDDDEDEDEL